ncbi:MAG: DNA (cytosine-5-)-methyltransferase [Bacteroidia bacterium]|nr:DNA (cytosine-5-)-methyltransferase [Bacteroidia bacterium]
MNEKASNRRSSGVRAVDLFAGIGGMRLGFEAWGAETVFACDLDPHAQSLYEANFGVRPAGDLTRISPEAIPDHDVLLAGFPCQPFSIIGKMNGFADTRGTLFFAVEEILRAKRPYAFLLENVKQLATHDGGKTFETIVRSLRALGYCVYAQTLNALDFGLPQKRERLFIVGFAQNVPFVFPRPAAERIPLDRILEPDDEVDPRLFASDRIVAQRWQKLKTIPFYPSIWHENKSGNVSVLPYSCALRSNGSHNYLLVNGRRRLSPREMLRLQGFPEDFKITVGYSAMRKTTGNSVAVPVVRAIAQKMLSVMSGDCVA